MPKGPLVKWRPKQISLDPAAAALSGGDAVGETGAVGLWRIGKTAYCVDCGGGEGSEVVTGLV